VTDRQTDGTELADIAHARTVFIPLHKAISNLLCQFYDYVFGND